METIIQEVTRKIYEKRDDIWQAVEEAVRARIPQKVWYTNPQGDEWQCPTCGAEFESYSGDSEYRYCPYCGQAWDKEMPEPEEDDWFEDQAL